MVRKKQPVVGPSSSPRDEPPAASIPMPPSQAAIAPDVELPKFQNPAPVFRPKPAAALKPRSPKQGASNFMVLDPGPAPAPKAASSGGTTATNSQTEEEEPQDTGAVLDSGDPDWASRKRHKGNSKPAPSRSMPMILGPIPGAPANERRANRLWRLHLNGDLLKAVLQNVKRKIGHTKSYPFLTRVPPELAPDYHDFVRPEEEMWLHQISDKLRNAAYADRSQFLADFQAIQANCTKYNTPGAGKFGGPALVPWAEELVAACRQELETIGEALDKAEASIKDPECPPPFKEEAAERLAPVAQRVVLQVPLPVGFKHTIRMTSSKPAGWVQYEATCPRHNCVRTADRVSKLVDIFRSHAYCRPEWRQFAQQPGEDSNLYQDRLRDTFNFQKGPPPNSTSTLVNMLAPSQANSAQPQTVSPAPSEGHVVVSFRPQTGPGGQTYKVAFNPVERQGGAPLAQPPAPLAPHRKDNTNPESRKRKEAEVAALVGEAPAGKRQAVALPGDVRKLLQLEKERYRLEARAELVNGSGLVDQSWGERSRPADDSVQPLRLANGHAASVTAAPYGDAFSDGASPSGSPRADDPTPLEWDGSGYFPRPWELAFLRAKLSSPQPASLLLLTGPPGSGKSALLEQARKWWREAESESASGSGRAPAPWLQWDCRTAAASEQQFAASLKAAIAEFAHGVSQAGGAVLPPIRDRDHLSYIQPEEWTPRADGQETLSQTLDSLAHWWPQLQAPGRRLAAIVLDSAEKLSKEAWAPKMLLGLEQFARQGVHVVLASSDCTFPAWLGNVGVTADMETVGNLPPSSGRAFFKGLLAASPAPVDMGQDWQEIRMVCGGNAGLLRRCHQSAAAYQSLPAALKSIWKEAGAKVRQGLEPAKSPALANAYSTAVGVILDNPVRAISATELENALGPEGRRLIASMADSGLLLLREASSLAADIPSSAYGPLQDRVITLPSAAHVYFWSLLSKAGADALSHGLC